MPDFYEIPNVEFDPTNSRYRHIEIVDIGELNSRKDQLDHDIENPHRVQFNLIIFFQKGQGSHFIDFTKHRFEMGSIVFVYRNQIQAFDFSTALKGKAILFTDEFLGLVSRYITVPVFGPNILLNNFSPVLNLSNSLRGSVESLIQEMINELEYADGGHQIVTHMFCSLLMMVERERALRSSFPSEAQRKQQQRVVDFVQLVEHHFTSTRNAAAYAERMHLSYKTLNQYCKSVTTQTAKQLIDKFVILEAKRRLILEDKSIQLLSSELGFDEETNFVKYFKKHTLITPRKFRKSL